MIPSKKIGKNLKKYKKIHKKHKKYRVRFKKT